MIYPKDNRFVVSSNIHSIGLQNNMTSKPTYGSIAFKNELVTNKNYLTAGVQALVGTPLRKIGKI